MMNFKSKGIAWVGNIYQHLETMCNEVDNIVSKDPVKYVENQVHIVGKNMKKFCTEVAQVVDPVRCETQAVALKGNVAVGDYIRSMIGVQDDHGGTCPLNYSYDESSDVNSSENQQPGYTCTVFDLVNQSTRSSGESCEDDEGEGENSDSALGKIDDVSTKENSDLSTKDDAILEKLDAPETLELTITCGKELLKATLSGKFIDCNNVNAFFPPDEVSPSISIKGDGLQSLQKEKNVCYSPPNDSERMSDASGAVVSTQFMNENACVSLDEVWPSTLVDGKGFQSPQKLEIVSQFSSNDCDIISDSQGAVNLFVDSSNENACVSLDEVLPATSVDGKELQCPQKVGTVAYDQLNDSDSVPDTTAVAQSDLALSVPSSCGFTFTEPHTLPEHSFNGIMTKVVSCGNPSAHNSDSLILLFSSTSAPTVPSIKEVAEKELACSQSVLSLESAGRPTDSRYCNHNCEGSGMETIDLSDKVKLEESCVMVDDSILYEASRQIYKLRSWKKKFQDVFNSKKRLSKEYEQLAVWFGDLGTESSQVTTQDQLPSHVDDSEWELL